MNDTILIKPPASLKEIEVRSKNLDFGMASDPRTGALLAALASSKPGGRILELGTGTGIGTAWLLSGMDSAATLISVDTSPEFQAVAKAVHGHDPRLTLILQDGIQFLRARPTPTFDLIFADAIPGKYDALEDALALVNPGGFYVIDDMLPQPNWPEGHDAKVVALLERLSREDEFQVAPLSWSSGIVLLVRRSRAADTPTFRSHSASDPRRYDKTREVDSSSPMAPKKKSAKVLHCPTCGELVSPKDEDFPFCSDRCRKIDLGKWAMGVYKISSPVLDPEVLEDLGELGRRGGNRDDE